MERALGVQGDFEAQDQGSFELPPALLALVLRFVPQKQRPTSCTLVCRAWAAAAIAATDSISLRLALLTAPRSELLQTWLQQHGQHLQALEIQQQGHWGWRRTNQLVVKRQPHLTLPTASLPQLKTLKLHGVWPKLLRSANSTAAAAAASMLLSTNGSNASDSSAVLPQLKELSLSCRFDSEGAQLLSNFSTVTALTSLTLDGQGDPDDEALYGDALVQQLALRDAAKQHFGKVLQDFIGTLPLLQRLSFPAIEPRVADSALLALTRLAELQSVGVCLAHDLEGSDIGLLQLMPDSLRDLYISDRWYMKNFPDAYFHFRHARKLSWGCDAVQLSGLLGLKLDAVQLYPAILASMTQLQRLQLLRCRLLPLPYVAEGLAPSYVAREAAAAESFLAAVAQLSQLQVLVLCETDTQGFEDLQAQEFSALTASSKLQHLALGSSGPLLLPKGAVQHMFPPGRGLAQLTHLTLESDLTGQELDAEWCVTAADIRCVAECCPSLRHLGLGDVVQPWGVSAALTHLRSCTSLHLEGAAFGDDAAGVVAGLPSLRSLTLWSPSLTDEGASRLAALTRLTNLQFWGGSDTELMCISGPPSNFINDMQHLQQCTQLLAE